MHFSFSQGHSTESRTTRGFTLIELLVVTSIVSLLIGLLLPALSRARDSARLAGCLSNLHQVMLATSIYGDENNDAMPTMRPYGVAAYSSYNHGGRYSVNEAYSKTKHFVRYPFDRPLNSYVHPNLPLGGTPSHTERDQGKMERGLSQADFLDKDRYNFPIFECPADNDFNYQMDWRADKVSHVTSAYNAVGTSYMFNIVWLQYVTSEYRDFVRPLLWHEGTRLFKRARLAYPSEFIAYYDDPAYFAIAKRRDIPLYHHKEGQFTLAFLDGHAESSSLDLDEPYSGPLFLFVEQRK